MADREQLATLRQGVGAWNRWRRENPVAALDLSGADLCGVDLCGANLVRAFLRGALLRAAVLRGADLRGAFLCEAVLAGAVLRQADLTRADLSAADLTRADLGGADLTKADLSGADLSEARLVGVNMRMTKLHGCRVYGVAVWDVDLKGAEQKDLIIMPRGEPPVLAEDLEMAPFLHMLITGRGICPRGAARTSPRRVARGRATREFAPATGGDRC